MATSRVMAGSGRERSKDDWYCKSCADYWGGHYVNRGHRVECYKCKLAKGQVFFGKPSTAECPSQRVAPRAKPDTAIKENARKRNDCQEVDGIAKLASEIRVLKTMDGAEELLQLKQQQYDKLVSERQAAKPIGAQRQKIVYAINDAEKTIKRHKAEMEALEKEAARIAAQIAEKATVLANCEDKLAKARKDLTELDAKQPEAPNLAAGQIDGDKLLEFFKCCFPNVAASAIEGDKAVFQTKWDDFLKSSVPSSPVEANVADATAPADSCLAGAAVTPMDEDESVLEAAEQQFRARATTAEGEQKRQFTAKADAVAAKMAKKLKIDQSCG